MARVNVGIDPKCMTDQHLLAESVEITMITGHLRSQGYKIKGNIPMKFSLGKGHVTFFKNKLTYLQNRLYEVNCELLRRGFNPSTNINLSEFPNQLINDWKPKVEDSHLVRIRMVDRIVNPLKATNNFHKFKRSEIYNMQDFTNNILTHKLNFV